MAEERDAVPADAEREWDAIDIDDIGGFDVAGIGEPFDEDLWLDGLARKVGMGHLSDALPGSVPPSYLYALVTIGVLELVLGAYSYAIGEPVIYLQNPFFLLQPIGLLAAVYGSRSLRRRYHEVTVEMRIRNRTDDPERLTNVIPSWLPWTVFLSVVAVNYVRLFALGGPVAVYQDANLAAVIGWTVANPVWASIATQFFTVYVAVTLIAPRRLRDSDVGVDFLDPEGLGGLRPIGELVKHAYYYVVAGLVAIGLVLYGPAIVGIEWERTTATNLIFTTVWLSSVATVGYAVFTLHQFMRDEKRRELHRLRAMEERLVEDRWGVGFQRASSEKQGVLEGVRRRMERVSATQEYPATFSIWSQLLLSIVIPKAVQLVVARI
ncbi:hypothetical protein DVK05_07935 [Halorubrum sp. Atlit-8R]|uniref:hypothetical protein n=1 Tax=unclassified Halorubrum TaxID=2642239 RepID=UPI000EF24E84|nr:MULTISPECIES: hypothetical protein [unclassified Halorubrum]RLM63211.1 hypothetical protein DVK08_17625 [Halorubrum sp. Atlit-9R]RLM81975.1 hypothetical protein DVK05_07935 [Halorubrum sp. Atlit-8R]